MTVRRRLCHVLLTSACSLLPQQDVRRFQPSYLLRAVCLTSFTPRAAHLGQKEVSPALICLLLRALQATYTLDALVSREHAWPEGSYMSYRGHDGATSVFTEGVDPVTFPSANYFTATFDVTAIPESATIGLLALGALVVGLRRKSGT